VASAERGGGRGFKHLLAYIPDDLIRAFRSLLLAESPLSQRLFLVCPFNLLEHLNLSIWSMRDVSDEHAKGVGMSPKLDVL